MVVWGTMNTETTTKNETKWLIIRDGRTPGVYTVWSQHKTQAAANARCRALARNRAEGHTVAIPASDRAKYGI